MSAAWLTDIGVLQSSSRIDSKKVRIDLSEAFHSLFENESGRELRVAGDGAAIEAPSFQGLGTLRNKWDGAILSKLAVLVLFSVRCFDVDLKLYKFINKLKAKGYHYREDVNKERKIGDFLGYSFLLILLLLLLPCDSRDSVADLMKTSPPIERILDIPGPTISQLRSIPLQRDRQRREAAVLDRANEEVLVQAMSSCVGLLPAPDDYLGINPSMVHSCQMSWTSSDPKRPCSKTRTCSIMVPQEEQDDRYSL
ncbi:hypothetical protein PIB30_037477 [Stylosanthes scabra]|uniref:Uncharacterized protein n=1 Tax=Stylosanthes scabra TaxID=79078 RepID=A0ABU6VCQ1_9FABA|nr:hypothetical protein [Stylosanthes scabra]